MPDLNLKEKLLEDLRASRRHLEYSYNKACLLALDRDLSEEELEVLESFSSRFARYSDLILSRYLRFLAREKDPAFRGSAIDIINLGEKFGWIKDAAVWRRIRELRNLAAHEYESEDSLSGGDIDILVISEALTFPDKLDLLSEIKTALGDQRIDLSIKTPEQSRSDAFARQTACQGVCQGFFKKF